MMTMRNILKLAPVLALALIAGCGSTPLASPSRDAEAKRFEPAMNSALLYIYRPAGYGGRGVTTMWVDGRLVGESLPETYFRVAVRPGRNRITVSGADQGRLEIETRADGVYFVEAQVAGETQSEANTVFRRVAPETGKAAVAGCCRMLETWRPEQPRINF